MSEQSSSEPVVSRGWYPARIWRRLIEPAATIREPELRRRARLLSALLVVTLLLSIASILFTLQVYLTTLTNVSQMAFTFTVLSTLLMACAYGLSRTRLSELAALLTITIMLLATFITVLNEPANQFLLAFPILGGLMSGIFLTPRATGLVFVLTFILIPLVRVVVPDYPVNDLVNASIFVLIVGAVEVVGATIRLQDMKQIEVQSRDLVEREGQLQAAMQGTSEANEKLAVWVEELEQRNAEIVLLTRMAGMLQTCQKADEAYAVIEQYTRQLFPATSGAVYLIHPSRNYVEAVVSWGKASAQLAACVFAPVECWALRRGQKHLMHDHTSELPCQHVVANHRAAFPGICMPMVAQGEALGVLHLEADEAPMQLSDARQLLVQSVAEQLSLALSNLNLREILRHESIRDSLTDLFNRRYLEETFERELRRAVRTHSALGVIIFDIDHFKHFNDTLGHEAGDALLHELGIYLNAHIRGADVACRYGGEEFALVLPDSSLEMTRLRAEELRVGIAGLRVPFRGRPLGPITVSLGVAAYPDHGEEKDVLLRLADAALYRAKQEGRNRTKIASL